MRLILFTVYLMSCICSYTQELKNEKEQRMMKKKVPQEILLLLDTLLEQAENIRFYKETDGDKHSFEAKMVYAKKRYSIEFNEKYQLEDIEVIVSETEVTKKAIESIKKFLSEKGKYRILKIQKQYSAEIMSPSETLKAAFDKETAETIRFEIEVSIKEDGKWIPYEILFTENGDFIISRKITRRSSDYILY